MTKLRTMVRAVCLVLAVSLTLGCGSVSTAPEASVETAEAFLQTRTARNAAALHRLLTQPAQKSMSRADLGRFLAAETFSYGNLGAPVAREAGWVQILVSSVRIAHTQREVTWSEFQITMHHDGSRWRVAWAEPLFEQSLVAYGRNAYDEQLRLGLQISEIDPHHYRGYLEKHFSYRGLARFEEAEIWLGKAADHATPPQQPDVLDAKARFHLSLGQAGLARAEAERSLQLAKSLVPTTYSKRWQADTMVVLARAQLALGDRATAATTAMEAQALDPQNGPLAVFLMELTGPGLVKPGQPINP